LELRVADVAGTKVIDYYYNHVIKVRVRSSVVVKTLCYKKEGRGFGTG
jgi:hypothetical protein